MQLKAPKSIRSASGASVSAISRAQFIFSLYVKGTAMTCSSGRFARFANNSGNATKKVVFPAPGACQIAGNLLPFSCFEKAVCLRRSSN